MSFCDKKEKELRSHAKPRRNHPPLEGGSKLQGNFGEGASNLAKYSNFKVVFRSFPLPNLLRKFTLPSKKFWGRVIRSSSACKHYLLWLCPPPLLSAENLDRSVLFICGNGINRA